MLALTPHHYRLWETVTFCNTCLVFLFFFVFWCVFRLMSQVNYSYEAVGTSPDTCTDLNSKHTAEEIRCVFDDI